MKAADIKTGGKVDYRVGGVQVGVVFRQRAKKGGHRISLSINSPSEDQLINALLARMEKVGEFFGPGSVPPSYLDRMRRAMESAGVPPAQLDAALNGLVGDDG